MQGNATGRDSTKLVYVPAAKKNHQFWMANRHTSRFPRNNITIPTAALPPVIPAPVLNRENTLAHQIITLRNERDTAITQGNGLAAERTTLLAERDAAIAQRNTAIGLGLTASAEQTTAAAERNTALNVMLPLQNTTLLLHNGIHWGKM
jgi:hypothetical protein